FDDYSNRGTAAKSAEMNLLYHMEYEHDSKIFPETLEAMGEVVPTVKPTQGSIYVDLNRLNERQKKLYQPILDSINKDFQTHWPKMDDKEKMIWKYQRYMQDYLGSVASVDDNVGRL